MKTWGDLMLRFFLPFHLTGAILIVAGLACSAVADDVVPQSRSARRDMVGVSFDAPPVMLYLVDARGKRVGVDFTRTISADGIQEWGGYHFEFRQYSASFFDTSDPTAWVDEDNIENDDPDSPNYGKGQPTTGWNITLMDAGQSTYEAVYTGMNSAAARLNFKVIKKITIDGRRHSRSFRHPVDVLVEPGVERRLRVSFDPQALAIQAVRVMSATELVAEIGLACRLGLIAPDGVCQSLQAKAQAAAAARERGNLAAARGSLKALLNEIKAQGGKHVKEPALTILREEAEALLKGLSAPTKSKGKSS